jgi:HK97 family phage prohead protease
MSTVITSDREVRVATGGEVRALRAADDKPAKLVGYAAVYDQRSLPVWGLFYEIVRRGAFTRALKGEDDVCAFNGHDQTRVLGRNRAKTLKLSDDDKGLKVEIDLPDTQEARDLTVSVERGDITQMSFGFRMLKQRWTEERTPEGRIIEIRELLEVELFDVSPVAFGQYPQTEVDVRSRDACLRSREEWRRSQLPPGADSARRARLRLAESEG